MRKDLELFPFKIQIIQRLSITDQVEQLTFCNWAADIAHTSSETGMCRSSVHNKIRKDLELFPFQIQTIRRSSINDQVE